MAIESTIANKIFGTHSRPGDNDIMTRRYAGLLRIYDMHSDQKYPLRIRSCLLTPEGICVSCIGGIKGSDIEFFFNCQ